MHRILPNQPTRIRSQQCVGGVLRAASKSVQALHNNERGAMSLVTVLTLLFLVMLLGMIFNVGRQANAKIRMQNAADSGTYAGGGVLARGMNSLAFSNHLLCDVFAMTAFLREGRDKNAQSLVPEILDAWKNVGKTFEKASFAKFQQLGSSIPQMADAEQKMVDAYTAWAGAWSESVLPTLEQILSEEMIPKFDQSVVQSNPDMAQIAAMELGRKQGPKMPAENVARETPVTVLWRTRIDPVGGDAEGERSTIPAVDPVNDNVEGQSNYHRTAVSQRKAWSQRYLNAWNQTYMQPFDSAAKMSQFGQLWRGFTNGQLKKLLEEDYPNTNLPFVIRNLPRDHEQCQTTLEEDYMFVGVAYRKGLTPTLPGMFHDPFGSDEEAFAQGTLFIPLGRLMKYGDSSAVRQESQSDPSFLQDPDKPRDPDNGGHTWDLFCQNWCFKLVPATDENILAIMQTPPQVKADDGTLAKIRVPQLNNLSTHDLRNITSH